MQRRCSALHLVDEIDCPHIFVLGEDDDKIWGSSAEPQPWIPSTGSGSEIENATATINYTSGTTARSKGKTTSANPPFRTVV